MYLWCYSECISTPGKLKNQPDHGGNRTRDLWFGSPMLSQLNYEVKSVRVCDISELSLVPIGLFDFHRGQADFSACPVWIYTQSNTTNTLFTLSTLNVIGVDQRR